MNCATFMIIIMIFVNYVPKGKRILPLIWIYKNKINSAGVVIKHKARTVAQGFRQLSLDQLKKSVTLQIKLNKNSKFQNANQLIIYQELKLKRTISIIQFLKNILLTSF